MKQEHLVGCSTFPYIVMCNKKKDEKFVIRTKKFLKWWQWQSDDEYGRKKREKVPATRAECMRENWKSFSDNFWIMMMTFPFCCRCFPLPDTETKFQPFRVQKTLLHDLLCFMFRMFFCKKKSFFAVIENDFERNAVQVLGARWLKAWICDKTQRAKKKHCQDDFFMSN